MVSGLRHRVEALEAEVSKAHAFVKALQSQDGSNLGPPTNETDSSLVLALSNLQKTLIDIHQREEESAWVSENLADVGHLLQQYQGKIDAMSDEVLKLICRRCNANQAALFILNEDEQEPFLELRGMYAYGRKKYVEKRIELGNGLPGQVILEGGMTLVTDVPANYVKITSGLGEATPRCLILLAMEANEKKVGVLELAFFHVPPAFHIDFLKRIVDSISRAIMWTQESDLTRNLLTRSESLSQELKAQEEELRQNLEEMSAIQEDMARKNDELERTGRELQIKREEVEKMNELIESKLETQRLLYEVQLDKMRKKIDELKRERDADRRKMELIKFN